MGESYERSTLSLICIVDTETSGLPNKGPLADPTQPHLVELGAVLCEPDGQERASLSLIIRPEGYEIPENVAAIHGITTDIAERAGVPLIVAMTALTHLWGQATILVAHNYEFDAQILRIAIARLGRAPSNGWPAQVRCTMKLATPVVNLPPTEKMLAKRMRGPKRPSLQEAHTYLMGEAFEGAHGALADCRAAARVFFKLRELGHC